MSNFLEELMAALDLSCCRASNERRKDTLMVDEDSESLNLVAHDAVEQRRREALQDARRGVTGLGHDDARTAAEPNAFINVNGVFAALCDLFSTRRYDSSSMKETVSHRLQRGVCAVFDLQTVIALDL